MCTISINIHKKEYTIHYIFSSRCFINMLWLQINLRKTNLSKMKNIFIFVLYFCLLSNINARNFDDSSSTIVQGSATKKKLFVSGELIFEDDFETFDLNKWTYDGNTQAHVNEFQLYTDSNENSYTQNGLLHIKPTFYNQKKVTEDVKLNGKLYRNKFHPIRSARISTKESFSFMYGVVEVNARVPSGDWLFPAIWLMPRDDYYGNWPLSGEIDIMESRGNKHLVDSNGTFVGVQQIGSTLHWGPNSTLDKWPITHFTKNNNSGFCSNFHIYKLVWTPDILSFYVDGQEVGIIAPPNGGFWEMGHFDKDIADPWINGTKLAPFDKQFYLILNLAIGGTSFFPDTYINENGKPWNNSSPDAGWDFWEGRDQWIPTWNLPSVDSHFLIDYVRVWAL